MTHGIGGSSAAAELAGLGPWPNPAPAIGGDEYLARIEKARSLMARLGAEALMIGAGASLNYFAGVPWAVSERLVCMLLHRHKDPILVAPTFELGSLMASLAIDARVRSWEEDESPYALVADWLRETSVHRLALDPALSFEIVSHLAETAPSVDTVNARSIINGCRSIKSAAELTLMQQAKAMTLEVQRRAARIMRPGITTTEVRRFIEAGHRALGADGNSFCSVLFGRATAYPHGLPGEMRLIEDDVVLIDTGCLVRGYTSDITRTYVFGTPSARHREIWQIEHDAQAAAFAAVRPGVACEFIDATARAVLTKAGLGPDYRLPGLPHRTGHGIGLSIHEAPFLVRGDATRLAPGMCFSNEPMIVVPDAFGIRLEDHFHVTETGAAWFTEPSPSIDRPFG
jgi:Xaa-Pro dipeptidase